jgi:hypothetical protein
MDRLLTADLVNSDIRADRALSLSNPRGLVRFPDGFEC